MINSSIKSEYAEGNIPTTSLQLIQRNTTNHHLWRNGRLWWIHFTAIYEGWRQERIRFSLQTADLEEAHQRRDAALREWPKQHGCELCRGHQTITSGTQQPQQHTSLRESSRWRQSGSHSHRRGTKKPGGDSGSVFVARAENGNYPNANRTYQSGGNDVIA